jgi:hypothetical protein
MLEQSVISGTRVPQFGSGMENQMKNKSSHTFTIGLSALAAAAVVAGSTAEARSALPVKTLSQPARQTVAAHEDQSGSSFVTIAPCTASATEGNGRFQWVSGRHPFQGGTGAYGDLFFGGGANSRPDAVGTTAAGSIVVSPTVPGAGPADSPAFSAPSPAVGTTPPGAVAGPAVTAGAVTTAATVIPGVSVAAAAVTADPVTAPVQTGGVAASVVTRSIAPLPVSGDPGPIISDTPPAVTPEPASLLLIATGLGGIFYRRRASRQPRP